VVAFAGGFRAPFYRYWLSGFLADFGNGVRLAAFPLLAAQLTRSPAAIAAVTTVQGLPWLLLGTGAGIGAAPIAAATILLAWRHRKADTAQVTPAPPP
jgi:hypothetical protein